MKQATIPLPGKVDRVELGNIEGDLQATGWDRAELTAKTDGDTVTLNFNHGVVTVECDGDVIVYMPTTASLKADTIDGDADLRAIEGAVDVGNVGGDLQARSIGSLRAEEVGGDLNVRNCSGDIQINSLGDDASIHDVKGNVELGSLGSDLYLRGATGDVRSSVGSDAILYLQPRGGSKIEINAGSDILLRLPSDVGAAFEINSGDSMRIDLPGVEPFEESNQRSFTLGNGSSSIHLSAGDDVIVTSRAEEWESLSEFDTVSGDGASFAGEFVPADLHERINRQVEEAMRGVPSNLADQIRERIDESTRRAIEHSRRASERSMRVNEAAGRKVEAALRKAEQKIRDAERRSRGHHFGFTLKTPAPPVPPMPPTDPVSDEERLSILRMLQEKKISREQADQLLSALEGR
jgi:hypothetical protein